MRTLLLLLVLSGLALAQDAPPGDRRGLAEPRPPRRPIVLNADDVPAFPAPPEGFDRKRDGIPHGRLEMI